MLMVTRNCHSGFGRCRDCLPNQKVRVVQTYCGENKRLAERIALNWKKYEAEVQEITEENISKLCERSQKDTRIILAKR